jgi:chitodextrinase
VAIFCQTKHIFAGRISATVKKYAKSAEKWTLLGHTACHPTSSFFSKEQTVVGTGNFTDE